MKDILKAPKSYQAQILFDLIHFKIPDWHAPEKLDQPHRMICLAQNTSAYINCDGIDQLYTGYMNCSELEKLKDNFELLGDKKGVKYFEELIKVGHDFEKKLNDNPEDETALMDELYKDLGKVNIDNYDMGETVNKLAIDYFTKYPEKIDSIIV